MSSNNNSLQVRELVESAKNSRIVCPSFRVHTSFFSFFLTLILILIQQISFSVGRHWSFTVESGGACLIVSEIHFLLANIPLDQGQFYLLSTLSFRSSSHCTQRLTDAKSHCRTINHDPEKRKEKLCHQTGAISAEVAGKELRNSVLLVKKKKFC